MFKVEKETELTATLITKIVDKFRANELARFEHLNAYYNVKNNILNRKIPSEKPNNRLAHGFAKYITNMATSFFMGSGLRLEIEDLEYKERLTDVLTRNNLSDVNFEVAKEMSKCGISFELLYMDEQSEVRFKKFAAHEIIPVYSTAVTEFLEFAIRIWESDDLSTDKKTYHAAVYTTKEIIEYTRTDLNKDFEEKDREPHNFNDVPIVIYRNNEEQKSDYEDVITLIDAYDKAQSDTANDFEYFTDAYLVVVGADEIVNGNDKDEKGESKALKTLKQERILCLEEKGQAQWLIKQINDTAVENYKNRLYENIFFYAQVPALTDESFSGNLSGVAIRYKLIGLEQLAAIKENKFLPAFLKKLRLITDQLNAKFNRSYDAHDISVLFDRNMTDNVKELADIAYTLNGIMSRETILSLLPFVDDVQDEMEKIRNEQVKTDDYDNIGNIDMDKVDEYVTNS